MTEPIIEVRDLRKRFGAFEAVRGVSFDVERGEIFGYLGANGAGKSTTIRILCGLLGPTAGVVKVAGHDVARDPDAVRRSVGYMSQRFSLYPDLSALENLDFFGGAYGIGGRDRRARARTLLAEVELDPDDRRNCGAMPGGTRQRVALACALIHAPSIVFLDEPTAGVDPAARRNFWRIIRRIADAGTTVFVTTHYMDEAEYCARVGLMADGALVALDTPAALKRTWVPGRLLEVRGEALDAAAAEATPGVQHAEPFGAGLHVRGPADQLHPEAVRAALDAAGAKGVAIEEIEPTLEDVFLEVVRRGGRVKRLLRSFGRIRAINRKEWMHIGRDPATLLFAIGMPLMMLVLFGFAVSFDIDHIKTVVVDDDHSAASRELIAHLDAGATFDVVGTAASADEAEAGFRRNHAHLAIVIPRGYGRDLARGADARVQLVVDAADNTAAQSILGYSARLGAHVNATRLEALTGGSPPTIEARIRTLYNPSSRSVVFLVPGLIVVIQAMMAVLLTSLAIAREWERGSMEQLFATPVGRLEIVAGKLAPYFVIGAVQLLLVLAAGLWLFDVPLRGSLWVLGALSVTFLIAMLAQGLLISVVAKNQMTATQMAGMSSMLPAMLLSGFVMPIDNMPRILQWVTQVLPARHFVHGLRAVMLRDAPFSVVAGDVVKMAAFAGALILLCVVKFGRKVA